MPLIDVRIPFTLRFCRDCKGRHFAKGAHEVSRQELDHWFVQGCIAEGRAVVVPVPEQALETVPPGAPANHDEFADAMHLTIGIDLASESTELTSLVESADDVIQSMQEISAPKAPAKAAPKAPAKAAAKPKGKGK